MKTIKPVIIITFLGLAATACVQPPDFPVVPEIEFVALSQDAIEQGNAGTAPDTLDIIFSFTDGDGNLGDPDSINIFITDSRTDFTDQKRINPIPEMGAGNGISGEITLRLPNRFNFCCTYDDGIPPCTPSTTQPTDTVSYSIQIRDRDNNFSNIIQTDVITILCN